MVIQNYKHLTKETIFLLVVYCCVFLFCMVSDPIYSPDTYSYLKAMPYRQLGYVIFIKGFSFIFGAYFANAVVLFQALFSLFAVHYFFKKITSQFSLNIVLKLLLVAILIFPFFQPLSIANNICSEGLSYGLYLLFIAFGLDVLFNNNSNNIKCFAAVYIALVFVRGQFLFSTLIFAVVYFLINRKSILQRKQIINLLVFICVPLAISLGERTYHKLKDGFFKPTPFSFVNASTAPFYIANASDINLFNNKNDKAIFKLCYDQLEEKNLLLNGDASSKEAYHFFHENLPKICNQTVQSSGKKYFQEINPPTLNNYKLDVAKAYFDIENTCKNITLTLIKHNFSEWFSLYYSNLTYGFYSPIVLLIVIIIMILSFIKTVFKYQKKYAILLLLSALVLSNAMLISFASHSIMRYLFYNYALIFLLFINTFKLLKREQ